MLLGETPPKTNKKKKREKNPPQKTSKTKKKSPPPPPPPPRAQNKQLFTERREKEIVYAENTQINNEQLRLIGLPATSLFLLHLFQIVKANANIRLDRFSKMGVNHLIKSFKIAASFTSSHHNQKICKAIRLVLTQYLPYGREIRMITLRTRLFVLAGKYTARVYRVQWSERLQPLLIKAA